MYTINLYISDDDDTSRGMDVCSTSGLSIQNDESPQLGLRIVTVCRAGVSSKFISLKEMPEKVTLPKEEVYD